ncbi:MAG TPA: VOC family protein [Ohtaekwangia sp.]
MNVLKIKETCIYTRDLEIARDFYNQVLGFPVLSHVADKHIFFRVGSSVLLCFNPDDSSTKSSPPPHYGKGKLHFAFEVPDKDYLDVKMKIRKLGISIIDEVIWQGGKESFYFEDPLGNVLEILPDAGVWD